MGDTTKFSDSIQYTKDSQDGLASCIARKRTPLEVWNYIFDFATLLPRYADIVKAGVLHPDDYFDADIRRHRWSAFASSALRKSIACRASISQVCTEWRRVNAGKTYERIHVCNLGQLLPLSDILEESCTEALPDGYGGRTKQFSWSFPAQKGGQYSPAVVQSMVKITRYLPKLIIFAPSLHMGTTNVPEEVLGALIEKGATQSLQCFHLLGPGDLFHIWKLFAVCPTLTSVSLGQPWNMIAGGISMSSLRSLHFELNNTHDGGYIQLFKKASLPCLEQLSVILRHHRYYPAIADVLAVHGEKIKVLRLEMSKSYSGGMGRVELSSFLRHCPYVTDVIFDLHWFASCHVLDTNTQLRRLGFFVSRALGQRDKTPLLSKLAQFRDARLPKTLRKVRILDTTASSLRDMSDGQVGLSFYELGARWKGRGIRLDDMNGDELEAPASI